MYSRQLCRPPMGTWDSLWGPSGSSARGQGWRKLWTKIQECPSDLFIVQQNNRADRPLRLSWSDVLILFLAKRKTREVRACCFSKVIFESPFIFAFMKLILFGNDLPGPYLPWCFVSVNSLGRWNSFLISESGDRQFGLDTAALSLWEAELSSLYPEAYVLAPLAAFTIARVFSCLWSGESLHVSTS